MSNVDRLLEGALDIHVHFAPDPRVERRGSASEVAQQARSYHTERARRLAGSGAGPNAIGRLSLAGPLAKITDRARA